MSYHFSTKTICLYKCLFTVKKKKKFGVFYNVGVLFDPSSSIFYFFFQIFKNTNMHTFWGTFVDFMKSKFSKDDDAYFALIFLGLSIEKVRDWSSFSVGFSHFFLFYFFFSSSNLRLICLILSKNSYFKFIYRKYCW